MALTRVDDRSSSIVYSDGWGRGGSQNDYNDSVTYATLAGQTATLTFQGIGISVFGHIMPVSPGVPPPISSYSIDGGSPTIYDEYQDQNDHPDQQFYQSPILSNAQHTLVLTNVLGNHAAYFLDYFLVVSGNSPASPASTVTTVVTSGVAQLATPTKTSTNPGNPSAVSSSTPSKASMLSTMSINGTVYTVTISQSPSSLSPSSSGLMVFSSDSQSSNLKGQAGLIVGSSIGAVAVIILLAILIFFWLRRRRRTKDDWRIVSEFSNQPYSSQWQRQADFSHVHPKFNISFSQVTESHASSQDHTTSPARPPSYSQEPPSYSTSHISYIQSPRPSKLGYLNSPI